MAFIRCLLFVLLTFFATSLFAQSVTGEWYGVGHVKKNGDYNSYLSEMVLKQTGNKVTGVFKYFFKRDSIKVKITGTYFPKYRRLELNASPMLNFQAKNSNGADCPMEGGFTLMTSKIETTLTGQFNPTYDYRITCPAIDIKFVKYVPVVEKPIVEEPEDVDTVKTSLAIIDTIKQKKIVKDTTAQARPTPVVIAKDTTKPLIATKNTAVITRPVDPNEKFIRELYRRSFEPVSPVMEVDADSLKISFYDNGEIDNDTISVFFNRKPAILKQMLSKEPITLTLKLDTTVNEISMFAENLGRIAPNTAVAIIYAGEQRFELNLTSSLLTNATMRFRKKPRHKDPKNIN